MDNSKKDTLNSCPFNGCPIGYTLSVMGGKWKWAILSLIAQDEVIRYGKLKMNLPKIAHKTLSQQLKELEQNDIINRKQYNQMPPKVEYSLTKKGKTLIPILELMSQWGVQNKVYK
ncbi:helix-turn-helix domain-containing protein [Clostridium sp. DJ247]|uniref:winged helix-turn-helix transcriptional regulator n=1 Tax=Clostridium sp. DJ247 TaxID=2726188 RepID=UPI001625C713|nr:helix-turn-helix domain-containing protein [Clostridium sp. DJ247]MBC2581677.1 helix-turn-helix transcriptional regulator [Clostridium sp. DJ247]